jgi:thiol-disulfide isomerase/thioredoxin
MDRPNGGLNYMRAIKHIFAVLVLGLATAAGVSAQTNLTTIDGGHVDVQGQRGKVVVLAIGASWLPLSNVQADYTNALAKKYAGRDVAVYFVVTDSSSPKSKNFADDSSVKKFAFDNKLTGVTVLRDFDGTATLHKFHVEQVPSFVILDKNGVQAGETFGGVDPKYDVTVPMSRVIDKLL